MDSKRKSTGGLKYTHRRRDKRLFERGGEFSATKAAEEKTEARKKVRTKGGSSKTKAQRAKFASVLDKKTKKTIKAEILDVEENPANRQFARQNIITKNAVIKIKIGEKEAKARITSRPGQAGVVQGIIIE